MIIDIHVYMSNFFKNKSKKVAPKPTNNNDHYSFILRGIDSGKLDKDYSTLEDVIQHSLVPIEAKVKVRGNKHRGLSIRDQDFTIIDKVRSANFHHEPVVTIVGKEKLSYYITMLDIVKHQRLPIQTKIPCAGCRRIYQNCPLGIPIKYHPSVLKTITYYPDGKLAAEYMKVLTCRERKELQKKSTISPLEQRSSEKDLYKMNEIIENEYYDTDLMVCSFNCMYSVISESPCPLYKETPSLIPKLYYDIFGKFPARKILKAPSWRLREEYDGPLSDVEFEKCLQKIDFVEIQQNGKVKEKDEYGDNLGEKLAKNMRPMGRMVIVREMD